MRKTEFFAPDSEEVTTAQGDNLIGVPERGSHHNSLVAVLLVVVVDLGDTFHSYNSFGCYLTLLGW